MKKIFKVAHIRDLQEKVDKGEISYGKMVEILNQMANIEVAAENQRWVEKIENRIGEYNTRINDAKNQSSDSIDYIRIIEDFTFIKEEYEKLLEGEK